MRRSRRGWRLPGPAFSGGFSHSHTRKSGKFSTKTFQKSSLPREKPKRILSAIETQSRGEKKPPVVYSRLYALLILRIREGARWSCLRTSRVRLGTS